LVADELGHLRLREADGEQPCAQHKDLFCIHLIYI